MIVPSSSRFAGWRLVEVAKYIPSINAVIRYQRKINEDTKEPIMMAWGDEVEAYRKKCKNVGVYTSVFRVRQQEDVEFGSRMGSLYFDFDSENDVNQSFEELKAVYSEIVQHVSADNIRVYFTGSKGFHLEVEAIALGISPDPNLDDTFRFIAEDMRNKFDLQTMDFAVYDPRRMWRLPHSQHQKTGLYKTELPKTALSSSVDRILKFAAEPHVITPPEPSFEVGANQWYKEYLAKFEEHQETMREEAVAKRLEAFNKYGTSILDGHTTAFIRGAWRSCMEKLQEEGKKAEAGENSNRNRTLSRQGFRMYLMYLESNISVEEVTNKLTDLGLAIGLEPNEISATLKSALRGAQKRHEEDPQGYLGVMR